MCDSSDCLCQVAMASTYERLRAQGLTQDVAFVGAASIYDHYHPHATAFEAMNAVKRAIETVPASRSD